MKDLDNATNHSKLVFIPNPFFDEFSIKKDLYLRKKKIIFSGKVCQELYPLRSELLNNLKYNPFLWNKISVLNHPGYPDVGENLEHNFIGRKYLEYLSQFYFMFLEPSRCNLEFLKYTECAYAHCVPVGKIPNSFTQAMKKSFFELDFSHLYSSIKRLFLIPNSELFERSRDYYLAMEHERNPAILNTNLDSFLQEKASSLTGC